MLNEQLNWYDTNEQPENQSLLIDFNVIQISVKSALTKCIYRAA